MDGSDVDADVRDVCMCKLYATIEWIITRGPLITDFVGNGVIPRIYVPTIESTTQAGCNKNKANNIYVKTYSLVLLAHSVFIGKKLFVKHMLLFNM